MTQTRTAINHLFIPGPTNVPEVVRMAMNVLQQDQRGPEFGAFVLTTLNDLKPILHHGDGDDVSGIGHWRVGGVAGQHAVFGRPGSDSAALELFGTVVQDGGVFGAGSAAGRP